MYMIIEQANGEFLCLLTIQDGVERWTEKSRQSAIYSMIEGARCWNHSFIRESDIRFEKQEVKPLSSNDILLDDIQRGEKVVLPHNHYLLRYNITEDEAWQVVQIREGKLHVLPSANRI